MIPASRFLSVLLMAACLGLKGMPFSRTPS